MKVNTSFFKKAFNFLLSAFALGELITLIFFVFVKTDFAFNLKTVPGITFARFIIILLFAFIINLANLIFKLPKLNCALKTILHSIIICLSLVLALHLMNGGTSLSPASLFVLILLFFVLYFLVFAIYKIIRKTIVSKQTKEGSAYTKQF